MTVELLETLSLISYISAGVIFLVAVALFFLLDVPKLFGDISGRTARKTIEDIRKQNESTGNKAYKPSAVNAERGKITDKITPSGKLVPKAEEPPIGVGTERLNDSIADSYSEETAVLNEFQADDASRTGELGDIGQTTVLYQGQAIPTNSRVTVDVEMFFTATSEFIE